MTPGAGTLRIVVVHSFYSTRQPSGENVVVELQVEALRRAGHEVVLISRSTDQLEELRTYPIRAGFRAATGLGGSPLAEIAAHAPDVVHVHNLFPNFGRRWVTRVQAPVVCTLHNYRPLCPAATLLRDGRDCTKCPDTGTPRHAVLHACFKSSRLQTVPVAWGTKFADDPLLRRADRVVTLSDSMRATYELYGLAPDRLVTVPNFVPLPIGRATQRRDHWLFVGRLSEEKGILELLRQWPSGRPLVVVGAGPREAQARKLAPPGVTFAGQQPHDEIVALMASARGLVFPSLWPEGLPTVYLEALASGLPVLAWPQSVVGTLVDRDGTGHVFSGDLPIDLAKADREFPALASRCHAVFDRLYSEDAWTASITNVYQEAISHSDARP